MLSEPQTIKVLPGYVIDQIKAGEVVERPASLVKEIIENSLDAQSSNINLELWDNGLECIHIDDDGIGIGYAELPLAFRRHATSKIKKFNDIYALSSYGFRGEALASMASIARISCISSPHTLEKGGRYIIDGGSVKEHIPYHATKQGTSLFIKNLFYNTPVRLKFIKSKLSEKNALLKVVHSFIINNPLVTFSIKWDNQNKDFYPAILQGRKKKRIEQVFYKGKGKEKTTHYISGHYESYHIDIYASYISIKSPIGRQQYIFVNDRLVEDKTIHNLTTRGLPLLWPENQSGHYCIFVKVPPNEIDVNIHPNKTSIKFFKSNIVYSLIKSLITKINNSSTHSLPNKESPIPSPSSNRGLVKNESSNLEKTSLELHPNLSLVCKQNSYYLVANQKVFTDIIKVFLNGLPTSGQHTTPLLISGPFPFDSNNHNKFDYIKSLCFELDIFDNKYFAVKSFPTSLANTPFLKLIQIFLSDTSSQPVDETFLKCAGRVPFLGSELYHYLTNNKHHLSSVKLIDQRVIEAVFRA